MSHPLLRLFPALFGILFPPALEASTVTYTFESNPSPSGLILPDSDPDHTGFAATFGANAPAGTFLIQPGNPSILTLFPDARIHTHAFVEGNPLGTDYVLTITANQPFTAVSLDWMSFSVPQGGYLTISDGLGKISTYQDDGTMTSTYFDGYSTYVIGNVAGTAFFETSAPVTSITITGWDIADSPPGSPSIQAIGVDNLTFTLVPEPHAPALATLGALSLLKRRRSS